MTEVKSSPLQVTIDGEAIYPAAGLLGRHGGMTTDPADAYYWNGFANPLFTREVAAQVCEDWTKFGDGDTYTMEADGRIRIDVTAHYPDPEDEPVTYDDGNPDGLYGTFTCGYCWTLVAP